MRWGSLSHLVAAVFRRSRRDLHEHRMTTRAGKQSDLAGGSMSTPRDGEDVPRAGAGVLGYC